MADPGPEPADRGGGRRRPRPGPPVPGRWPLLLVLAAALAGSAVVRVRSVVLPGAVPLPDMRVDVNAATAAELNLLPGIGPALADRIVAERRAAGPFRDVDDLQRVHGIGPAVADRVRPFAVAE